MANKNNIRSIRFSDEMADLIDRQAGNTFTEKFENLITRCVWELPAKEAELEKIEKLIKKRRDELQELSLQVGGLRERLNRVSSMAKSLETTIDDAIRKINL